MKPFVKYFENKHIPILIKIIEDLNSKIYGYLTDTENVKWNKIDIFGKKLVK